VVASNWGDIPNIVENGRMGLLHTPADPADLAEKIKAVYNDPEAASQRAEQAYRFVQRHTWRAVASRVLQWHNIAANDPQRPAPNKE
jgi:glycosyltransferase involved in cell wall biosynthesis